MPVPTSPFPIQLEVEFLDRLSEPVREGRAPSVSAIIRTALERFDFSNIVVVRPSQILVSVRLPAEIRRNLKEISRTKHTSVGQLVRAAVEAYLPQLESGQVDQLQIPAVPEPPPVESVLAPRPKRKPKAKKKKSAKRPARPARKAPAKSRKKSAAPRRRSRARKR